MRILITGICGFTGVTLARELCSRAGVSVVGIDNLSRAGSEMNRAGLRRLGISVVHGDLRLASDLEALPEIDWVIDAASNSSVLAGVDGRTSSRQLVECNLVGTINVLEFCKARKAGLSLLSTSRVYSIAALAGIQVEVRDGAFQPTVGHNAVPGLSGRGSAEDFPRTPPVSLYGATKLASEQLALEYRS